MIKLAIRAFVLTFVTLLVSTLAVAAAPKWQIVPDESAITFTATQNNAPATGKFTQFTGDINFDPAQLDSSKVRIVVDMNSVSSSYSAVADTLKTADWFDVKKFPQGIFTASKFTKTGNNTYQVDGTLTLRDKTLPVILSFVLDDYSASQFHIKGTATIKRTQFGIGQGEWAKTDSIKDDVQIEFVVSAKQ